MKLADRYEPNGEGDLHRVALRLTKEEWLEVKALLDGRPFSVFIRRLLSREMMARSREADRLEQGVMKLVSKLERVA